MVRSPEASESLQQMFYNGASVFGDWAPRVAPRSAQVVVEADSVSCKALFKSESV